MKDEQIETYQFEIYDGTIESLEKIVDKLKLETVDYNFDVKSKRLFIHKNGYILSPGDSYQYKIEE